jgi:hypothetical protein
VKILDQGIVYDASTAAPARRYCAFTNTTILSDGRILVAFHCGSAKEAPDENVLMRLSADGGRTWGNERQVSIGAVGETRTRPIWRRLGQARDWALELAHLAQRRQLDARFAIDMATELQPAPELAMVRQQRALAVGGQDPRRRGDVARPTGAQQAVRLRGDERDEASRQLALLGPELGVQAQPGDQFVVHTGTSARSADSSTLPLALCGSAASTATRHGCM